MPGWLLACSAALAEPSRSAAELAQLRQSIGDLQQQLAVERRQEKAMIGDLDQLERQLSDLLAQGRRARDHLTRVKNQQAALLQRRRQLEKQLDESRAGLLKLVRSSYMLGRQSELKLLLSQQSPAETARAWLIFGYLSKAKNRRIEAGKQLRRDLIATRADLGRRRLQLSGLLERLADNRRQLAAKRIQRAQALKSIRAEMARDHEQVAVFKQREQALRRLLVRLRRQQASQRARVATPPAESAASVAESPAVSAAKPPADKSRATMALEGFKRHQGNLRAPIDGRVAARFGQRKPESGLKWEGLMFAADEGAAVVAIYPGQVVFSDWLRGYGQLMVLDHGDGFMSLYGHNRALLAAVGAAVADGQQIGEAGATGGLSSAGLYFEIRHNGEPRDPLTWCRI